ncbi:hypothetical protein FALBO_3954, partial [Fusarium albosuccineum]
ALPWVSSPYLFSPRAPLENVAAPLVEDLPAQSLALETHQWAIWLLWATHMATPRQIPLPRSNLAQPLTTFWAAQPKRKPRKRGDFS